MPGRSRIPFQSVGDIDHGVERRGEASGVLLCQGSDFIDAGLSGKAGIWCFAEAGKADHIPKISVRSVMLAPYCTPQYDCKCN
jgi:hypothetical protein